MTPDIIVSGNTFTVTTGPDTRTQFTAHRDGVWVSYDKRPDVGATQDSWVQASLALRLPWLADINEWCANPARTSLEREACRLAWARALGMQAAVFSVGRLPDGDAR